MTDIPVCDTCGKRHITRYGTQACIGHTTSKMEGRKPPGSPCVRPPTTGLKVCCMHGAGSPQSRQKSAAIKAEKKVLKTVERVVAKNERREITDPVAEFAAFVTEVVNWKDAAASLVERLEDRLRFTDHKGAEQLRAEVAIYERGLDRTGKFLTQWANLGMDERLVRLDEARFALVERGLEAYRKALGIDDEDHRTIGLPAMAAELRRVGE